MQNFVYRYPGSRPFQVSDAAVFYGRDKEIKDFFDILMVEKLTVLFSRSGMGKTSLINAGLVPKFVDTFFVPLYIRLNNPALTLTQQFCQQYQAAVTNFAKNTSQSPFLWEKVKYTPLQKNNKDAAPLIILDQFEEVFTLYTPAERKDFVDQLADLANGRLPDRIQTDIKKQLTDNPDIDDTTLIELEQIPKLKILFAIRSDFLHLLDEISTQIPDILRSRIQLHALKPTAAQDAIQKPAQLTDPRFSAPPFNFSAQAIADIIDSLSNTNNEVESFQLQVLCRYIETKVLEQYDKQQLIQPFVIQPAFYGGKVGIKNVLNNFYTNQLNLLPKDIQLPVQKLVEEGLINENKRRRSLAEEDIIAEYKLPKSILEQLVNARLLRKEPRLETFYYEISHDSLIAPILLTYDQRHAQEEREIQEQQQQLLQQKLQEQTRKQYWLFVGILGISALAILAIGALVYSILQTKKLRTEQNANVAYMCLQAAQKNEQDPSKQLRFAEYALHYDSLANNRALNAIQFELIKAYYQQPFLLNKKVYPTPLYRQIKHHVSNFFEGITDQRQTLCFAPNAKIIATLTAPDSISIFKPDGSLTHQWKLPADSVQYISFAHNSSKLLIAAGNNAYLYDTSANLLNTFKGHTETIINAVFAPNDSLITTNAQDGTQKVWQVHTKNKPLLYSFRNVSSTTVSDFINFSPNSKLLFVTDTVNFSVIYNLQNGKSQLNMAHKNEFIGNAAFSPNSTTLYLLHTNEEKGNQLHEWDIYKKTNQITSFKNTEGIGVFSPNAQYLVQTYRYDSLLLYNLQTNQHQNIKTEQGYTEKIVFSPDSKFFVSIEKPIATNTNSSCQPPTRLYALWNAAEGNKVMQFADEKLGNNWQISANAQYFLANISPYNAKIWDIAKQPADTIQTFQPTTQSNKVVFDISFLNNNKMAVACGNQAILTELNNQKNTKVLLQAEIVNNRDKLVTNVECSPNGKHIATCLDNSLHIFDANGKLIKTFLAHSTSKKSIRQILFTPQNKLITLSNNNEIKIWQSESYELIKQIIVPTETLYAIATNSEYIAYATNLDTTDIQKIYLLPLKNLNQEPTLINVPINKTERSHISSLAFSPNGNFLLASFDFSGKIQSTDTTIIMWQLKYNDATDSIQKILNIKKPSKYNNGTPRIFTAITNQPSSTSKVMFSPWGNQIIAIQSDKGTISWFDLKGAKLYEQKNIQPKEQFSTAAFNPSNEYLVIGNKTAQVMRLKINPSAILNNIRTRSIYKLTNEDDLYPNNIPPIEKNK